MQSTQMQLRVGSGPMAVAVAVRPSRKRTVSCNAAGFSTVEKLNPYADELKHNAAYIAQASMWQLACQRFSLQQLPRLLLTPWTLPSTPTQDLFNTEQLL
ncbi:hypothetical protein HaLaN_14784, partial [Haematococcus lacustris]